MSDILGPNGKPFPQDEPKPQEHMIEFVAYETIAFDPYLLYPADFVAKVHQLRDAFMLALKPLIGESVTDEVKVKLAEQIKEAIHKFMPPTPEPPFEITFDPTEQTEDRMVATLTFKDPRLIADIERQLRECQSPQT